MESSSLITRDDINVVVTYFDGPKVTIESDTTLDFIISFYDKDELVDEHLLLASENVKKLNVFSRLIRSLNYLIWGDV